MFTISESDQEYLDRLIDFEENPPSSDADEEEEEEDEEEVEEVQDTEDDDDDDERQERRMYDRHFRAYVSVCYDYDDNYY